MTITFQQGRDICRRAAESLARQLAEKRAELAKCESLERREMFTKRIVKLRAEVRSLETRLARAEESK